MLPRLCLLGLCTLLCVASPAAAQDYDLPFKGEDLADSERIFWGRPIHSEGGVQKHGYDLGALRYDANTKRWTEAAGGRNEDFFVYGKPVYAMREGTVIACWRNAPENPTPWWEQQTGALHPEIEKHPGTQSRIYGGGNGFWIEHDDGTRAEYAHFIPGSVPSALCPHDDALLPQLVASPDVRDAWPHIRVPEAQQVRVQRGQLLGRVGNAGTSSAPHLHVHLEAGGQAGATKQGGSPRVLRFRRGLSAPEGSSPYGQWTDFSGKPIPAGPVLVWPARTLGGEYARHGFPADRFGAMFQHLANSGFWLEWIDTYNVGGRDFINHVWRPAEAGWLAVYLTDGGTYQRTFDDAVAQGFSPVQVESSVSGGQPRYSAVFAPNQPGGVIARHGLTEAGHQQQLQQAKSAGYAPVNVAVASVGGQRRYTVLYRKGGPSDAVVESAIRERDYQSRYDAHAAAGRYPIYLNAYVHGGEPYLSVVFATTPTQGRLDRHGLSGAAYQSAFESAHQAGMLTRAVTSFDGAQSQHRFAASWWKDPTRTRVPQMKRRGQ